MREGKRYLKITMLIVVIGILLNMTNPIYARDNWAYAAGIKHKPSDNIFENNAYDTCQNAMIAYNKAGYSAGGTINPTKDILWENLYATVQFFMGHGSVNYIHFTKTGIYNGFDRKMTVTTHSGADKFDLDLIGTSNVHWDADTILVTYAGCSVAGTDGTMSEYSIVRSTANRGADAAVGFNKDVNYLSLPNWADRYNQKLGEGYGIWDAMQYANSFQYFDGNVKSNGIWHHGNNNFKIGKYGNSAKNNMTKKVELSNRVQEYVKGNIVLNDIGRTTIDKTLEERRKFNNSNTIIATEENINKELTKIYSNFNKDNYIIENNKSSSYDVNTNEKTDEYIYYDYKLKIGDYLTDAAYTIVVKDNKIEEIYDNNVDIVKQEELLKKANEMKGNIDKEKLKDIKNKVVSKISEKYDNTVNIIDENYTYYYDIKNDKKYIITNYTSEKKIEGLPSAIAIDACKIEIE